MAAKVIIAMGGAPRAGKSTVRERFLEHYGDVTTCISTDQKLAELCLKYADRKHYAALHQPDIDAELYPTDEAWQRHVADRDNGQYIIARQQRRSTATWHLGVRQEVEETLATSPKPVLLIEGIAVLPWLISEIPQPVHATYLGNESATPTEYLTNQATTTVGSEDNWMHGFSPARISAYAATHAQISRIARGWQAEYGHPYFDMGHGDFSANVERVVGHLALQVEPFLS